MCILATLNIRCNRGDDSILRVVQHIVSIIRINYRNFEEIFSTKPAILELSFHDLMTKKFTHSHYTEPLFDDLAIIGISEESTKSLFCTTNPEPEKCFNNIFARRIVPSQDQVREIIRKRSQPEVPVDSVVQAVQEVQVDPKALAEKKRKQKLYDEFLAILD